jgi:hypothetical protein
VVRTFGVTVQNGFSENEWPEYDRWLEPSLSGWCHGSPSWYMRGGPQTAVSGVSDRQSANLRSDLKAMRAEALLVPPPDRLAEARPLIRRFYRPHPQPC